MSILKSSKTNTRRLCLIAVLTAITVVLAIFGTFRIGNAIKIPSKFISVFITGVFFGPIAAGTTAALGDIINAFLAPVGSWIPQLTMVEFISGFIYGIFFHKKQLSGKGYIIRVFICIAAQFALDMLITTWVLVSYGYFPSFAVGFGIRLAAGFVKAMLIALVLLAGSKYLPALGKELDKSSNFRSYANSFQAVTRPGLERINAMLEEMGNPQGRVKYIHIAGTNGKGSVAAFLQTMLTHAGFKTGKYISPNLIEVNERISIDGHDIEDRELNSLLSSMESLAGKVKNRIGEMPTQFEIWTAAAFKYFSDKKCDYVILETGLGGRLDATNAIPSNILSVITHIDFDHMAYLGDTLEKIAAEKAGIIKKGSTVISAPQTQEVSAVLKAKAEALGCGIEFVKTPEAQGFEGIYETFSDGEITAQLSLGGLNQLENAAVAVIAAKKLGLYNEDIIYGLENSKNPARFEPLEEKLIFDGGHNPSGVATLVANLKRYFPETEKVFIMASMKDKDITKNLNILNTLGGEFRFVTVKNNQRSAGAADLAKKAEEIGIKATAYDSLAEALQNTSGKLRVVCGSLYLYKDLKEL